MRKVLKNYPEKVNLILRNFPMSFHENALVAAKAFSAVCMQSPSLAYSYQRELFKNQKRLSKEGEPVLYEVAARLGANVPQMKTDMNSEVVTKSIAEDQKLADSHDFKAVPSFMIG